MCRALKWLFPLSWPLSYAPLNILLPQKSCTLHKSVTICDIFMHLYWYVLGNDDVSHTKIVDTPSQFVSYASLIIVEKNAYVP